MSANPPKDVCFYMLVRYPADKHQRCINSIIKNRSVHGQYCGKVIGLTDQVEYIEKIEENIHHNDKFQTEGLRIVDPYPSVKFGLLLMEFDCKENAEKWLNGTPDIKQKDWLDGGVDVIGFPAAKQFNFVEKPWIQMFQYLPTNLQRLQQEYGPGVGELESSVSGMAVTLRTSEGVTLRGSWKPNELVVVQCDTVETCKNSFYYSDAYKPLKQIRFESAQANSCVFRLQPISSK